MAKAVGWEELASAATKRMKAGNPTSEDLIVRLEEAKSLLEGVADHAASSDRFRLAGVLWSAIELVVQAQEGCQRAG